MGAALPWPARMRQGPSGYGTDPGAGADSGAGADLLADGVVYVDRNPSPNLKGHSEGGGHGSRESTRLPGALDGERELRFRERSRGFQNAMLDGATLAQLMIRPVDGPCTPRDLVGPFDDDQHAAIAGTQGTDGAGYSGWRVVGKPAAARTYGPTRTKRLDRTARAPNHASPKAPSTAAPSSASRRATAAVFAGS